MLGPSLFLLFEKQRISSVGDFGEFKRPRLESMQVHAMKSTGFPCGW